MMIFTQSELDYLATQRLARLATVAPAGTGQNSRVGFMVKPGFSTIEIGGRNLGQTKKFANIRGNPKVAVVIDDLASVSPWTVRGIEIGGTAEALDDTEPPRPGMSQEVIR